MLTKIQKLKRRPFLKAPLFIAFCILYTVYSFLYANQRFSNSRKIHEQISREYFYYSFGEGLMLLHWLYCFV